MPWDFGTFTVVLTEKASFQSGNRTNSSLVTANRPELEVETITDDAKQKFKILVYDDRGGKKLEGQSNNTVVGPCQTTTANDRLLCPPMPPCLILQTAHLSANTYCLPDCLQLGPMTVSLSAPSHA